MEILFLYEQVTRDIIQKWSQLAASMISNAEQLRKTILDTALKELIEKKSDSKKFLDSEKNQYDIEHRKVSVSFFYSFKRKNKTWFEY